MNINTIFADLMELPRWVPYKLVYNPEREKFDKVPHNGSRGLSTKDSSHWMTAAEATTIVEENRLDGIGIVMTGGITRADESLIGIDYDGVNFDEFKPFLPGYTEVSPSGEGIRQFAWVPTSWAVHFKDTLSLNPPHCHHAEVYLGSAPRFLTVTGNVINAEPIQYLDYARLAVLMPQLKPAETAPALPTKLPEGIGKAIDLSHYHLTQDEETLVNGRPGIDRSQVFRKLLIKLIDAKSPCPKVTLEDIFVTVWEHDHLRKYCLDHRNNVDTRAMQFAKEEIERAYEASWTGRKARLMSYYDKEPDVKMKLDPQSKAIYQAFPVELYDDAPGLVGEIARWIMRASYSPRKEYAYACALSMVACLIGPYCTVGSRGSKLNLYVALVGKTSSGKNEAIDTMGKLMAQTKMKDVILDFPASEAALRRQLNLTPNILIRVDELAHKFESMQGNSNGSSLGRAILEAYNGARMPEKVYADERKCLSAVENPYVQMLGGTTEKIWDVLKTSHMDDGTINRFIFVCLPELPPYSRLLEPDATVSQEFKDKLNKFWQDGVRYDLLGYVPPGYGRKVVIPSEVMKAYSDLDKRAHDLINTRAYGAIYSRYSHHALKIASILAVGDGRLELTLKDFDMAESFLRWCLANTYYNVEANMADTHFEKQTKKVLALLEKEGSKMRMRDAYKRLHISRREMEEVVQTLELAGEVEVVEDAQEREWIQLRTGKAD